MKPSGPPFGSGPGAERKLRTARGRSHSPIYARPASRSLTEPIRATLHAPDRCTALGMTASSHAPVLALCRLLIEAGYHPATPLEAYRGEVLCLRVRTIGEAARLRVATHGVGFEPVPECTGASLVRQNEMGVVGERAALADSTYATPPPQTKPPPLQGAN
jgi:hypothetical protein